MTKYCTLLLVALSLPVFADSQNYYKYKDAEGHTIISNTLPPEVSNQGYEVISPLGNVVEKISPKKTAEELNKEAVQQKQQEEVIHKTKMIHQKAEAQAHKDDLLLRSFSSLADIDRAKNDKLSSIVVLEEIIRENMMGLNKQLTDAKLAALNYQHNHQKIPDSLQKTIHESERQIRENTAFLERKKNEKNEIHTKYELLKERFQQLQPQKAFSTLPGENTPESDTQL